LIEIPTRGTGVKNRPSRRSKSMKMKVFLTFFKPQLYESQTKMGPQRQCRPLIYILFILLTFFYTFSGVFRPSSGDPQEVPNFDPVFSFLVQILGSPGDRRSKFWGW
jgi:hypothetical protein